MRSTRARHQRPRYACRWPMREEWGTKSPEKSAICSKNGQTRKLRANTAGHWMKTVVFRGSLNISGNLGSSRYFSIAVPAGATNLKIQTSGGTGDADLYVRFAQAPTLSMYDCKGIGGNNLCHIPAPNNGEYHIMLHGVQSFSGLVLTADYQKEQGKKVDITNIINLLLLD